MHLGEIAGAASFPNLSVLDAKTAPGVPMVVVLGPSFATSEALTAAVDLTRVRSEFSVVLVAEELSTALLQQAMRSGVTDVITLGSAGEQLGDAVRRAGAQVPQARIATVAPPAEDPAKRSGHVISVFSAKGGAGKSVVAAN